jgi:hypothetical protein
VFPLVGRQRNAQITDGVRRPIVDWLSVNPRALKYFVSLASLNGMRFLEKVSLMLKFGITMMASESYRASYFLLLGSVVA